MNRKICSLALIVALSISGADAASTSAEETYDLLFRTGTLDELARDETLRYQRTVSNVLKPETGARDTGKIELTFSGGTPEEAKLRFLQDGKHRTVGSFPASVGNPIIMYFVETVVRDMAESAGGSPFYIRNRVKAALVEPAEIETRQLSNDGANVDAQTITLRPFSKDPNADRMQGFGELELTVTMSDAVPGWYHSLVATVPGQDGAPIYSSVMTLEAE